MNSGIKACIKENGNVAHQDSHGRYREGIIEMFYFKACQKCQGDLTLDRDSYGSFLKCLQCGSYTDVEEVKGQKSILEVSASKNVAVRAVGKKKAKTAVAA